MKYGFGYIMRMPLWKLLFAAIWILGVSINAYNGLSGGNPPSFQEMMLYRLNDVTAFVFFFILLLLIADKGFKKADDGVTNSSFWRHIVDAVSLSLIMIILYMIFSLIVMLVIGGTVSFEDTWRRIEPYGFEWSSPTLAVLIITPLFFLRLVFLICLVAAVNGRCRKTPFGYAAGFAVCLISAFVYFQFHMQSAWGIFFFEHAYLESIFALTPNAALDIAISVLYWLLLIGITALIYPPKNRERSAVLI